MSIFFSPFYLINVFVICEMALDRGYSVEGFSGQNDFNIILK